MSWVWRDGQRLTAAMLYDLIALDDEFFRRTGERLKISAGGGVRTSEEQERIFRERYRVQWSGNGPYNDVRWWNGQRWVRVSGLGTVAVPKTSNHEINVAAGRRGALDLYDTGRDAGLLTRGSFRANVFDEIAGRYGYDSEGYGFGETWHKRYNRDPWRAVPSTASAGRPIPKPAPVPEPEPKEYPAVATGVIYTNEKADEERSGAIIDTESGLFSEFKWFPPAYADGLAVTFGAEKAAKITRGHFDSIKKDMAGLRAKS